MMFPPNEHAPLSPSRLQRIIDCPGSFRFGRKCEEEQQEDRSSYAEEGSMLHAAVESYLRNEKWLGPELNHEQMDAVKDAIDYFHVLENTLASQSPTLHIEERVYLKEYSPSLYECSGTCDIIMKTKDEIHVIDWKFGKGVPVYAEDNDQLYAYAAGAAINPETLLSYKRVYIHCIQPRLDSYDVVDISPKSLLQWINGRLIPGCSEALGDSPTFHAGTKQCRWCPAKVKCRHRYHLANQTAAEVFAVAQNDLIGVTMEELTALYARAKQLDQYIKDIGAHIIHTIKAGTPVEGWKMVAGRSLRRWKHDEETTIAFLERTIGFDEMFASKLISPAQAEKLDRDLKKSEEFQELVEKPAGKPTLASEHDKRQALEFRNASQIFGDAQ